MERGEVLTPAPLSVLMIFMTQFHFSTVFTLSFVPIPMDNGHTEISVKGIGAEDEL